MTQKRGRGEPSAGRKRTSSERVGRGTPTEEASSTRPPESTEERERAHRPGVTARGELMDEEADRMVTQALDCELPEPEPFVRILLLLYDLHEEGRGPELSDSIHKLMTAAYNNSNVHSANFDAYLDSVRRG